MGTNFYYRHASCDSCGRYEETHVGKRSAGWSFGFRGYRHELEDEARPDWGYVTSSPFGFPVLSRADWRKVFVEHPGELRDEYGETIYDPLGWLDALPPPDVDKLSWENSLEANGSFYDPTDPRRWRDAEGFRFWDGEFS